MKFGYPNHPRREVESEIEWAAANGFDFVDLTLEPDAADPERVDPARLRKTLEKNGLSALGHMAWYLPIGSPMAALRDSAVRIICSHLPVFADAGIACVTIHANWPPRLFTEEEGIEWQIESLSRISETARRIGVRIMYEPVGSPNDHVSNIRRIIDAVPSLLLHLDTGHCNLNGFKPDEMIRFLGDRLFHLHVHDNHGDCDNHLPPGTGRIDWREVFKALRSAGYDNTMTIEVFSPDREYILLALRRVREMWTDSARA